MEKINYNSKFVDILFFSSLVIIICTFYFKYGLTTWLSIIIVIFLVVGIVYKLVKHFSSNSSNIDILPKRFFNATPKSKLLLSLFLIIISVSVIIFDTKSEINNNKSLYYFGGSIWDGNNEPLSDVIIEILELELNDTTDNMGKFLFQTTDSTYKNISFIAHKEGYNTYKAEGSIGNKNYSFIMTKK